MRKFDDKVIDWNIVPPDSHSIEKAAFQTNQQLQKLYETKLMVEQNYNENPIAPNLLTVVEAQIELLERDREVIVRAMAITELLEEVAEMPRCELPPIPKKRKARKARKPKDSTDATS